MNKHEIQTIKQEAQRFTKGIKLSEVEGAIRLELPYLNSNDEGLYFFITKRPGTKRFSLLIPVESIGLVNDVVTLGLLQQLLRMYGLLLTQEGVILEESNLPLNQRFRNLAQAIIGVDGIRRLWTTQYKLHDRSSINATESETAKSISNTANDSSSR